MPATGNKPYRPLSLSIRLRADGFSFFLCDVQTGALVRGEHFAAGTAEQPGRLRAALAQPEYNSAQIAQTYVLADGPFTHVPLEHFRRDEAAALYALAVRDADTPASRVGYNILPMLEVVVLYAVAQEVEETVVQYFPTARFFAAEAMLLERLAANAPMLAGDDAIDASRLPLFVVVGDTAADGALTPVSVYHFSPEARTPDGPAQLDFANTFLVANSVDALYFVLNVWQSLGMTAPTDEMVVMGHDTPRLSELYAQLQDYVIHLRRMAPADLFPNVSLAAEREVPLELMALLLNRI